MSHRDAAGLESRTINTAGRETNHTFPYLNFNTRYVFEVRTVFIKDSVLGEPVQVTATTGSFSAPVAPLTVKVLVNRNVRLSWSAPQTVEQQKVKVSKLQICCLVGVV